MAKNVNLSNVATVNPSTLNYPHPYFVPIDDGDEETIKFYKRNDVPVAHIALPGRMKHYYAVFNADTQEYADLMNRTYNNWEKKAARAKASQEEYESSYDVMVENGYDAKDDTNNPEEIIAYKTVINALTNALDELTDEKLRACKMVANGESQREVAEELGISRRTLRDRKDSAMKELGDKLKDYKQNKAKPRWQHDAIGVLVINLSYKNLFRIHLLLRAIRQSIQEFFPSACRQP